MSLSAVSLNTYMVPSPMTQMAKRAEVLMLRNLGALALAQMALDLLALELGVVSVV